jgi:hypothetical protein
LPAVVFNEDEPDADVAPVDLPLPGRTGTQTNDPSLFRNLWTSEVDDWEGRVNVVWERSKGSREGSDGRSAMRSERSDMADGVGSVVGR